MNWNKRSSLLKRVSPREHWLVLFGPWDLPGSRITVTRWWANLIGFPWMSCHFYLWWGYDLFTEGHGRIPSRSKPNHNPQTLNAMLRSLGCTREEQKLFSDFQQGEEAVRCMFRKSTPGPKWKWWNGWGKWKAERPIVMLMSTNCNRCCAQGRCQCGRMKARTKGLMFPSRFQLETDERALATVWIVDKVNHW